MHAPFASAPEAARCSRRRLWQLRVYAAALAVILSGCSGDDSTVAPDAGGGDATAADAGAPNESGTNADHADACAADASDIDAGNVDAERTNAASDASEAEAEPDASRADAESSDATTDAAHEDATTDASPVDASPADAAHEDATTDAAPADAAIDTQVADAAQADATSGDAGSDAAAGPVTYSGGAQPIYQAKCAPCHTTGGSGGVNFASMYADTQRAVNATVTACTGLDVGACTIVRIKNGQMPRGAGCSGNPTTDQGNAACLTQAQQDTIQAWITDGQRP
jgi:hypothetical protein